MVQKGALIKTGKAKQLYQTDDPELVWVEYLDQATALNGKRKAQIPGKGAVTNRIDSLLFRFLAAHGVPTAFVAPLSPTAQLNDMVDIIPLEVIVRNYAAGSFQQKFAVPYLTAFESPVIEYCYKADALDDPSINTAQAQALGVIALGESAKIQALARQANQLLQARFAQAGLLLVDFKVEFGRQKAGALVLADEISPDSCRLLDQESQVSLDKDVFRKETGDLVTVYQEVLRRLEESEASARV